MKFFYTFGSRGQAHIGGWIEIMANSREEADRIFIKKYPLKDGLLNCAFIYTEEDFKRTIMYKHGNFGRGCHEVLP